jgi:hypothetical protein
MIQLISSSAKGSGGYLSSFVEAIFWAIGAAVVGGIQHRLRGGGEVSHRVSPVRGGWVRPLPLLLP